MSRICRRLLALAALAAALAAPTAALASPAATIYSGQTSGEQQGIIGTMQIGVEGRRAATDNGYFSKCGEFNSGWMKISSQGTITFNHQWANGYGLKFSGRISGSTMTGHVQSWGGGCSTGTLTFKLHKVPTTM
jgi:hypothetical protein